MKTCFRCNLAQPLSEFYAHSQMADGHLNKCKSCTRADTAKRHERKSQDPAWLLSELRRHRAKARAARADGRVKPNRKRKEALARYRATHPEQDAARRFVKDAIKIGLLDKKPCEVCGKKAQAHHPDYKRPLFVQWLCPAHHADTHVREREAALIAQIK